MGNQRKILIVDDEPDFVESCRRTLEAKSYQVITASSKALGQEMMKVEPDIIIIGTLAPAGQTWPCSLGDVDCSGNITPEDALLAFKYYLQIEEPPPYPACDVTCAADWDGNANITPADALCIFEYYLGGFCECVDPVI